MLRSGRSRSEFSTLDPYRFVLALDASGSIGKDLEAGRRNRSAATVADSVSAAANPVEGFLNLANLSTNGRVETCQHIVVFPFRCLLFEIRSEAASMTAIPNDASKPLAQFDMPLAELVFDDGLSFVRSSHVSASPPEMEFFGRNVLEHARRH